MLDRATAPSPHAVAGRQSLRDDLASALGADRVSTSMALREQHARGEGLPDAALPDIVVFPQTAGEVAAVARLCSVALTPMIPFGAGTSLEGHLAALRGGVSIDLSRMNRIIEVSPQSMDCRVEAGVTRKTLNHAIRDTGLFFPVDPGADASIGGMAATRASGTNAVRYGTMRESVLGLTVVTPDGRIVRTGTRARKSAAGYDLTRLYVGSEGTLGIITEVQLRLQGIPEAALTAVCQFDSLADAVSTVTLALQMGLQLARIELLDEVQMAATIGYAGLDGFRPLPTLLMEFHGSPASTRDEAATMEGLAADQNGLGFHVAATTEERERLWKARHDSYFAVMSLAPGKSNMGTDACVPIEMLAPCILETKRDIEESGLTAPIVGHVGDGNFHLGILFDPNSREERARADALAYRVAERAIAMGGTCSGEHGVGLHKIRHMASEHGEGVALMQAIKQALDPLMLMNPGKLLPQGDQNPL